MGGSCCTANDDKMAEASGATNLDPMAEAAQDAYFAESAMMDPLTGCPEALKKSEGSEPQRTVEVLVKKDGPTDRLGMDVKHVRGRLVIVQIFVGGAIDRANQASLQQASPGDTLEVGDVIVQVNDKGDLDTDMVAECQMRCDLRIRAVRRFQQ
mmetsp:Transcript_105612/g.265981  ORF Transcript_105612/g.265981 Transcript_105612/m.265981 type:complete len:154 (+) Transcript_105612:101-562(+)